MKIYRVDWQLVRSHRSEAGYMALQAFIPDSAVSVEESKAFVTKDKADLFLQDLTAAANVLRLTSEVKLKASINEEEVQD